MHKVFLHVWATSRKCMIRPSVSEGLAYVGKYFSGSMNNKLDFVSSSFGQGRTMVLHLEIGIISGAF